MSICLLKETRCCRAWNSSQDTHRFFSLVQEGERGDARVSVARHQCRARGDSLAHPRLLCRGCPGHLVATQGPSGLGTAGTLISPSLKKGVCIIHFCGVVYAGRERTDVKKTKEGIPLLFLSQWWSILYTLLPRPCFGDGYFKPFQSKVVPL